MQDDNLVVRALEPDSTYEFVVVAVDGEYLTESGAQEVSTYGIGMFVCLLACRRVLIVVVLFEQKVQ